MKRKWKQAKFSKETKEAICNRDWGVCIICGWQAHSVHHVYFGIETNYWEDRNDENQWTTLCLSHHQQCHSCSVLVWVRQECIDYLNNL